jgi:hypothetical protein
MNAPINNIGAAINAKNVNPIKPITLRLKRNNTNGTPQKGKVINAISPIKT